mmetsp:Transcript_10596/g.25281  ORF Transcript_10596/g.25281 Transcript_10596/m.25281 type:complete len:92 (+) Transcript_10596:126-401(+)
MKDSKRQRKKKTEKQRSIDKTKYNDHFGPKTTTTAFLYHHCDHKIKQQTNKRSDPIRSTINQSNVYKHSVVDNPVQSKSKHSPQKKTTTTK